MTWTKQLQVCDVLDERFEARCLKCGRFGYVRMRDIPNTQLYLDEVEAKLKCRTKGCGGRAMLYGLLGRMTAFIGGMA